ncbi:SDA1-domain-containing protein [Pelagophyceae sp. CCMP2097]|nr:SDA1-domain-containing protein [Pelagophyceae sp. CCMP2097]|mmetsp:Transcript_30319/g.102295  ORF Transcript_30319/g.102295 Transcript_30319/m.102295 type:complete len:731 (+) Transcript_30319:109-2301(+)
MKVRQHTLPVLQNLLKRDPAAYKEEFEALWKQYLSELEVLRLADANSASRKQDERRLGELATFVSHTCTSYAHAAARFAPELVLLLRERGAALQPDLRLVLAQACVLARSKGLLDPIDMLELAFELIRTVNDKPLRSLLQEYIVSDIRRSFAPAVGGGGVKKVKVKTPLRGAQKVLFRECSSAQTSLAAAKAALDALVLLYRKRVWTDAAAVNAIGRCCVDQRAKLACTAVHFFLGVDQPGVQFDDFDEEGLEQTEGAQRDRVMQVTLRGAEEMNKHSKKTRKRQAAKEKNLKAAKKLSRKKHSLPGGAVPVFPAIDLLEDPHRLCEAVLSRLRAQKDKFEVRLTFMDFISRVACAHKLQLLPFYSYMQRYLVAHQRDVTRLLAIFAQACHDHIPPDELQPIARHIADAFVSERNAPEAMALGINALRELVARVPSLLDEGEMIGFARDLAAYAKHRDKSVVVAARGWINVVRERYPALLKAKDRGKASAGNRHLKPTAFGAADPPTQIEGSDLLAQYEAGVLPEEYDDVKAECHKLRPDGAPDDGEDDWVDVASDEEDDDGWESVASDDDDMESGDDEDVGDDDAMDEADPEADAERAQVAIESTRILSDDDFARIRLLKKRQAELARTKGAKKGSTTNAFASGFLRPDELEAYSVKQKTSVAERKAKIVEGRDSFQHKLHAGGKTNTEKKRTKNFLMLQKKQLQNPKRRRAGAPKEQLKRDKNKRRRL